MDSRKNVDAKLKEEQTTRGTLFCAGMIAGEGLVGILLAVFAVFGISTALSIDLGNIGGVVLMIVMIACLLAFSMKKKEELMSKKKQSINYLDLIPQRAETLRWHTDEATGLITLEVENTGVFNTIAQKSVP